MPPSAPQVAQAALAVAQVRGSTTAMHWTHGSVESDGAGARVYASEQRSCTAVFTAARDDEPDSSSGPDLDVETTSSINNSVVVQDLSGLNEHS